MAAHARLSPSSAHQWVHCPGSVKLNADLPDRSGKAAAEGTVFHHFVALALESGADIHEYVGQRHTVRWWEGDEEHVEALEFTEEMANHAVDGLEYLRQWAERPGAIVMVEKRLDLTSVLGEKAFGTGDAIIILPQEWRMLVFDWKYGAGVPVSPVENEQAMLYALGALQLAPPTFRLKGTARVEICIEQPRCPGGGGVWETTVAELRRQAKRFREAAELTRSDDPPFSPSPEACRFCTAGQLNKCDALSQHLLDIMGVDEAMLDQADALPEGFAAQSPERLTLARIAELVKHEKMIRAWLDSLRQSLVQALMDGEEAPGVRLVPGRRPPRRWADPAAAEEVAKKALGDAAYVQKLKTPAALAKEMGAKAFETVFSDVVMAPEPPPALSFDQNDSKPDYRAAVQAMAEDMVKQTNGKKER